MAEGLGRSRVGLAGEDRRCLVRPCGSTEAGKDLMRVKGRSGHWRSRLTASLCFFFFVFFLSLLSFPLCHTLHVLEKIWGKKWAEIATKLLWWETRRGRTSASARQCFSICSVSAYHPLHHTHRSSLQPHLTIKSKESTAACSPGNQTHLSALISPGFYWQPAANRYYEVLSIHLGLILTVISVQHVTIRRRRKAAINPFGVYLMMHHMGILQC